MIHVYHFSMQKWLETTYQSKKHIFLKYVTGAFSWCNLKKLNLFIALVMTIAYVQHFSTILKLKTKFLISTQTELCKLWSCFLQTAPLKGKRSRDQSPVLYHLSVSMSLWLSVIINFALECMLHMNALCIFHSIIIRTCVYKQTYIDLHLPKPVVTN